MTIYTNYRNIIFALNESEKSLSEIVGTFKSITTNVVAPLAGAKISRDKPCDYRRHFKLWQPNYYEHIIRNEKALDKIRKYITNNPNVEKINWEELEK